MNREELNELAALNAAGALPAELRASVERELAGADDSAKREAEQLHNTATLLAIATARPQRPSPALKQKILQRVQGATVSVAKAGSGFYFIDKNEGRWTEPMHGVRLKELSVDRKAGRATLLVELAPRTKYPVHHHSGGEECFVVAGDFHVEGRCLGPGDFHHAEADTDHRESFTENGCQLLIVVAADDYLAKE